MAQTWVEVQLYSFKTSALEGGKGSAARPGRTLPLGETRYPLYRRLGGPQGRSGRAENLAPTGIRFSDRPARSSVAIPTELPGPHLRTRSHININGRAILRICYRQLEISVIFVCVCC